MQQKRRLTQAPQYHNRPIAADSQTACDTETLESIEQMLTISMANADCPRLLTYGIHFPPFCPNVNEQFRRAQADFCKAQLRQDKSKTRYVGFKDNADPYTIRVAAIYDNQKICDDELLNVAEAVLNRKVVDGNSPVIVRSDDSCGSVPVGADNLDQCFYRASRIARVPVVPQERQRVLFSSKG